MPGPERLKFQPSEACGGGIPKRDGWEWKEKSGRVGRERSCGGEWRSDFTEDLRRWRGGKRGGAATR